MPPKRRRRNFTHWALTAREMELVALLAKGLSNDSIAAQLHLSIKAVLNNINVIFAKKLLLPDDKLRHRRVTLARMQWEDDSDLAVIDAKLGALIAELILIQERLNWVLPTTE